MAGGLPCDDCCGPSCEGCLCSEEQTIQLTGIGWENGYCEECELWNSPLTIPKVDAFTFIDHGDTCLDFSCDDGCYPGGGHKCYYQIDRQDWPCTQIGAIPVLTDGAYCDGGGCPDEFQSCFYYDSLLTTVDGTASIPDRGCTPTCSATATCAPDPENEGQNKCFGGDGGTVSDCAPMTYTYRVAIWQSEDRLQTAVNVSIVIDEFILIAGAGCAVFSGPCDELDIDVPITSCSGSQWRPGDGGTRYRYACYLPTSINVMAI